MLKRLTSWLILVPLCVVLIIFALSNRQMVQVNFDPLSPSAPLIPSLSVPLYLVIFGFLILGVLLGGIATWFSQGKQRREKRRWRKEAGKWQEEAKLARDRAKSGSSGQSLSSDLQLQQSFD